MNAMIKPAPARAEPVGPIADLIDRLAALPDTGAPVLLGRGARLHGALRPGRVRDRAE